MKRVTDSVAAKNFFYIDYLKMNTPITPAAFSDLRKGLPRSERDDFKKKTRLALLSVASRLPQLRSTCFNMDRWC